MEMKHGKRVTVAKDFATVAGKRFVAGERATLVHQSWFSRTFRTDDGRDFSLPYGEEKEYIR
jgi:hypothetical protein